MSDLARRILEACYVTRPLDGDPNWYDQALAEVQRLLGEQRFGVSCMMRKMMRRDEAASLRDAMLEAYYDTTADEERDVDVAMRSAMQVWLNHREATDHERNMSDWISVEDRLPRHMENVLFVAHASVYHGRIVSGWFERDLFDAGLRAFVGRGAIYDRASHWMPLPKLPDGVEEAS